MPRLFARDAGLDHIVVIKLDWRPNRDPGDDPDGPVNQARAWCAENVEPHGWNLRYTSETCYVRFARDTDAVLMIVAVGGTYRRQPKPRTGLPRRNPWLEARRVLGAAAEAAWDAEEVEESAE